MQTLLGVLACFALAGCGFQAVSGDGGGEAELGVGGGGERDLGAGAGDDLNGGGGGGSGGSDMSGGGGGGGMTGADLSSGGMTGADLSSDGVPGNDLAMPVDDCPAPQLLIGVSNVHNGAYDGGRVARLSLAGGQRHTCKTLGGGGLIGAQVAAVAAFAGGVATISDDHAYLVDPTNDVLRWLRPSESRSSYVAIDAFALENQTGQPILATGYGPDTSSPAVREIFVFDGSGATPAQTPWCIQVSGCTPALPLSLGIYGMTADPAKPSHLLALDTSNDVAAWSVDPYTQTKANIIGNAGMPLGSIAATRFGTVLRYAWVDDIDQPNRVAWSNDSGGPHTFSGPIRCSDNSCPNIVRAVPDPTSSNHFFVLCDAATASGRKVIELDSVGACSPLVDGTTFGSESMLTSLGVGL